MGVGYSDVTLSGALDCLEGWIARDRNRCHQVVATGFHGMWVAQRDPTFGTILDESDMLCADGIAPVVVSRLRGRRLPGRVPGPDLLEKFLERADTRGYSSFFLGDTEETLEQLRKRVESEYPGHHVAGTLSPPFRPLEADERREVIERINESSADVLWVALGTPKQDRWIHRHRSELRLPVAVGVGAAFRFLTERTSRAPRWIRRIGFEWLWRLAAEPGKMWRRTLVDGPRWALSAVKWLLAERVFWREGQGGHDRNATDEESA